MMTDPLKDNKTTQRAPLKREAPVPGVKPGLRRPPRSGPRPQPSESAVLDRLFRNHPQWQFDQGTGFHGGPSARRKGYRLSMWSLLGSMVDTLILISASCIFMLMFSLVVKTSFGAILQNLSHGKTDLVFFAEIFLAFAWIYMIAVRGLMGATIGEWTCDLRLGQPQERLRPSYIFKVILRSSLIMMTGVILLPILSLILGRDIPGRISGLQLFSLK